MQLGLPYAGISASTCIINVSEEEFLFFVKIEVVRYPNHSWPL